MADFDLQGLLSQFQPNEDDRRAALRQALMAAGFGMMGAPRGQEGAYLGRAGMMGLQGYQGALHGAADARGHAIQQAAQAMQLQEGMRKFKDADLMRDQQLQFAQRFGGGGAAQPQQPPSFGMADRSMGTQPNPPTMPGNGAVAPQGGQGGMPSKRQVAEQYRSYGDYWMGLGRSEQAKNYYDAAEKMMPKAKESKNLTMPDGQRVTVQFYDDGTHEVLPFGPDKEKAHFLDTGGQVGAVDPFTGKPVAGGGLYNKTVTPDAVLSSDTTRRGQNMTDSRAREFNAITRDSTVWETDLKSGLQVNKRTGETRPITAAGQSVGTEDQRKKTTSSGAAIALIDQAVPIVKQATGSYVGAGQDAVAQAFGFSLPGSTAIAKLKALEGQLMLNQPRMEGPQSDKDAAIYRQMAAEIGDPTVPRARKLAALAEVRKLHERYAAGPAAQSAPSAPANGDSLSADEQSELARLRAKYKR